MWKRTSYYWIFLYILFCRLVAWYLVLCFIFFFISPRILLACYASLETPTRYSKVFAMSRIDLTPAETTATGVRPSSVRSALTSKVVSAPRWTPPIPPVTKIGMPAWKKIRILLFCCRFPLYEGQNESPISS